MRNFFVNQQNTLMDKRKRAHYPNQRSGFY
jgi:hypothetical protein